MLEEFEAGEQSVNISERHHEDTSTFNRRYMRHVCDVVNAFRSDGNPFQGDELLSSGIQKLLMSPVAEKSVREARNKGEEQCSTYVKERLVEGRHSVHEVLPRNNL